MIAAPPPNVVPPHPVVENADTIELLAGLWAQRRLIIVYTIVVTGLAVTFAFLSRPIYRSSATLVSASNDRDNMSGSLNSALGSVGGLASLAGLSMGPNDAATEECLAVLKSRSFTEKFISEDNLLPELFPKLWDSNSNTWKVPPKKQPTLVRGFRVFDQMRTILTDNKTGLITLQIDFRDREKAAAWANELVARVNDEMRNRAIASTDKSIAFLEKKLATSNEVGTREAVSRLMEGQIKQRMVADVAPEYSLRVVDRALPSEPERPVRPKKLLYIAVGLILGVVVGVGAALARMGIRRLKQQYRILMASREQL